MTTNKTTEQEKAKTVYDTMVRKFGATSPHTADARDKYINTVTVEIAHREAEIEDIKHDLVKRYAYMENDSMTADHVEALAEEADRRAAMVRQQDENEREQSDMDE